jgi:hypothetical protein
MLGLILLRFFTQSDHIDAFRSMVGEAPEAGIIPVSDPTKSNTTEIVGALKVPHELLPDREDAAPPEAKGGPTGLDSNRPPRVLRGRKAPSEGTVRGDST